MSKEIPQTRELILNLQKGNCALCNEPITKDSGAS